MIKGIESITLFSENAKKLADFYKRSLKALLEILRFQASLIKLK